MRNRWRMGVEDESTLKVRPLLGPGLGPDVTDRVRPRSIGELADSGVISSKDTIGADVDQVQSRRVVSIKPGGRPDRMLSRSDPPAIPYHLHRFPGVRLHAEPARPSSREKSKDFFPRTAVGR